MALSSHPVEYVANQVQSASSWIEWLARMGYTAKGAVYVVVGVLAAQVALGIGGATTDTAGALRTILGKPFGQLLLGLVAVGLVGYALWRFVQAVLDPEHKGTDARGIVTRVSYAISGLIYGGLARQAAELLLDWEGGEEVAEADRWTAILMSQPFGRWLVAAVGATIIGVGLLQLYRVFFANLTKRLGLSELDGDTRRWVVCLGRFGVSARGVVFGLIGSFLILAAIQFDPREARGLGGALRTLQEQSHGPWLLGIIAFGLVAYGIFEVVKAGYRRIDPDG